MAQLPDLNKIPGADVLPSTDPDTSNALDQLLKDATDDAEGAGVTPVVKDGEVTPVVKDENAPPVVKDGEVTPVVKDGEVTPVVKDGEVTPVVKDGEVTPVVKDDFDAIELPPHTKPKTGEAFDTVKRLAREKLLAADSRAKELQAKYTELESKSKLAVGGGMTAEEKKELAELRDFRKKLDVESDPEFKSFDTRVVDNTEKIYAKLLASGATKETIDKIKALGGPDKIEWEPILEKLPSAVRRTIESKLVENEDIVDKKAKAIAEAQKNADQFLKTRSDQSGERQKERQSVTVKTLDALRPQFGWLALKVAGAKATDAEKAVVEAHNSLVKEAEEYLKEAMADDSPEMRATVMMAGPELFKVRAEHAALKLSTDTQIKRLTDDLKLANETLDKVKKSSTTRLRESPASGKVVKSSGLDEKPEDALDRLAKEAVEA